MYLNCHTFFSLRYGTLSCQELINEAVDKGIEVLTLTDINNTSGAFEFVKQCKANSIKPVVGIEFRNEDELLYIGIAKNNKGFQELNKLLSKSNTKNTPLPIDAPELEHVWIIYPLGKAVVGELRENELVGVRISELNKLVNTPFYKDQNKLVMLHSVTFKDKVGFNTHRLLRAISKNTLLSKLLPCEQASEEDVMLPLDKLIAAFARFPKIINNTDRLLEKCNIDFNGESKNRKTFTGSIKDDRLLLEKLALDGLKSRYGLANKVAKERVQKELAVINKLGFNAYFLITWDILRYAISRNFSYVGRGSGANSVVAYCLKITDVDPIELDLYFERFLNPHRTSPPDFDIDFSWKERDEIIDYIFKRYGQKHTALLATYNTFKGRSVVRELGKVFGLPKAEIDSIINFPEYKETNKRDHIHKLIFKYAEHLQGKPNHLSIHAGGILISEEPISYYTATDLPPKNFPLVHFDMFTAEEFGFYKYDILGQRGLGHIKDAIELIKLNQGKTIDINTEVAKKDEKVRDHIRVGNTIGCFYIESPGMRMLLKKLKCSDYTTLVAASSIIRPGVAKSGMMQEYIYRFHNPESVKYLHPKMEELLKETYGVMVYQEDVIKVAHHWAGLDLGEADILRRAMSGKYRGKDEFRRIEEKFFEYCKQRGHDEQISKEVWRQIESFSGYSFSKAHSASFAVESYHSLFLKAHYPLEFMVAVINNLGGFYSTEFYVHEARKAGANIQAPCVNNSDYTTSINDKTIFIGFMHIKDLEQKLANKIVVEREANGVYKSLEDFIKRLSITLEQLTILIRMNAFRFTGVYKKNLLWEASQYFVAKTQKTPSAELFNVEPVHYELPTLTHWEHEDAFDQLDFLGFPLCFPFDLLPQEYKGHLLAKDMIASAGKKVSMIGYFVCLKNTYTSKGDLMGFGHFIDEEGESFDTIHFPPSLKKYSFKGRGFYLMKGKVTVEFDYPTLEVDYMDKLPFVSEQ